MPCRSGTLVLLSLVVGVVLMGSTIDTKAQPCNPSLLESSCNRDALLALGDKFYEQRHYAEAVKIFQRALVLEEAEETPDLLNLATVLVRLGSAMFHNTHSTAAEPILARALAIRQRILGDHPDTIEVLDFISLVRFANAEAISAEGLQGDANRMRARIAD